MGLGAAAVLAVAACSPSAPPGVDRDRLDSAVSRAVGDPNTCVLIGEAGGGRQLYRYNTHTACERELPSCEGAGSLKAADLLRRVARDGRAVMTSCNTVSDASRGVGWAAGPIEGTRFVYAAVMEGDRAFPGRMMADRLEGVFRRAGVSKAGVSKAGVSKPADAPADSGSP
ncbi:hypothetical protein [Phenylobacterium sp.]|uniref:hypothetical protein n=1 Tax=Phenylobacterium sp. TaxID=1871053 RepID=UPI00301D1243